jgi:phosphoribosylformylglycinamidine synthase
VGGQTARDCSNTIGVVRLEHSKRALGLALGCRPYLMRLDARLGALDAVFYPALSLAVKGFEPLALTDCLNFGNPENKKIMGEFVTSVESLSEACRAINSPVISGNVSFYNETLGESITSTPATALAGIRDSIENIPQDQVFKENLGVYLIYNHQVETGGALEELYKKTIHASNEEIKSEQLGDWQEKLQKLSQLSNVHATRVVGKFGLITTLIKMCSEIGFSIEKLPGFIRGKADFFKERLYETVFVVEQEKQFEDAMRSSGVEYFKLGITKDNKFEIVGEKRIDFKKIKDAYQNSWENLF